jgi:hypothetical protein
MNTKPILKKDTISIKESYTIHQHIEKRLIKYAQSMNQDWRDIKRYFKINTDNNEEIYLDALNRFLSSEGY